MLGVIHVLGLMLAAFGATYSLPVLAALISQDGTASEFIASALISTGIGVALAAATRRHARELKPRDGFLLVTVGWLLMSASAAIPLLLLLPHLSFTRWPCCRSSAWAACSSTRLRRPVR
jgi:trk system potassium uptake protein TrkH